MLNFKIENGCTSVAANGTRCDMLTEAIALETQLHRFVYRLGPVEYTAFLTELQEITKTDDFTDFLEKEPDNETRIAIPIPRKEEDN